ncbi:MAG: exo-alpha-sialidase [Phycisphaerae bacterium]|nr:exo-alpha-sialidase [Phycisphaerae bacterium]
MKCISKELVRSFHERPVFAGFATYAGNDNSLLIHRYGFVDASDTYDDFSDCISRDNGKTWSEPILRQHSVPVEGGRLRWVENAAFYDEDADELLSFTGKRVFRDEETLASRIAWVVEICRYHPDTNSWEVLEETKLDLPNLMISFCHPMKTSRGALLVPAQFKPVNPDGSPRIDPHSGNFQGEAIVMIGVRDATGKLTWRASRPIAGDPARVTRGMVEPTIAELTDGRIAMICRGSNAGMEDAPGYKWLCFSDDGGETFSTPEPLLCTDGQPFASGSNGGALFRSETNGRLFWIGNPALDEPPAGNNPRNVLAIFEVNETPFALKRETMCIIDRGDRKEKPRLQYSNFRFYQERPGGNVILYMSDFGSIDKDNWKQADYYRYRIAL